MSRRVKLWVIIPTYNERDNILKLLEGIRENLDKMNIKYKVLIVDDNSPDRTAEIVREYADKHGFVELIVRKNKRGLGSAILDGMKYVLEKDPEATHIATMDADLSHRPEDLPILIEKALEGYDLVQGSRYVPGGKVIGWKFHRRLISWTANMLIRIMYRTGIRDHTGNYKIYTRRLVEDIVKYAEMRSYECAIETVLIAHALGYRIIEAPIVFINRVKGKSKLSLKEILQWFFFILKFRRKYNELKKNKTLSRVGIE